MDRTLTIQVEYVDPREWLPATFALMGGNWNEAARGVCSRGP